MPVSPAEPAAWAWQAAPVLRIMLPLSGLRGFVVGSRMEFSLDDRTCSLSAGEFAGFTLGPRETGRGAPSGPWRAQLGQEWHAQLRRRTEAELGAMNRDSTRADVAFEVPLALPCIHRGWTFTVRGRIDQLVTLFAPAPRTDPAQPPAVSVIIREIKTVAGPLPADEDALRAEYPEYFLQAVAYLALLRSAPRGAALRAFGDPAAGEDGGATPGLEFAGAAALRAELVFVELGTGITQTVVLTADDEGIFRAQLQRLVDFLDLQLRARERLRGLRFHPAFAVLRPGQESIQDELLAAFGGPDETRGTAAGPRGPPGAGAGPRRPTILLFEAPTGYGKTGVLLEFALGRLRFGRFARLLYLTGKSTGQLQVMRTLAGMTSVDPLPALPPTSPSAAPAVPAQSPASPAPRPSSAAAAPVAVAAWQVRPKAEHCVNSVFHCVRDVCPHLADLESRWARSGLARFYLFEGQPRDIESLRAAGRDARVCPYEITRAALPFNDVLDRRLQLCVFPRQPRRVLRTARIRSGGDPPDHR